MKIYLSGANGAALVKVLRVHGGMPLESFYNHPAVTQKILVETARRKESIKDNPDEDEPPSRRKDQ